MTNPAPLEIAKDNIKGMALTEYEVTLVCQAFIAQAAENKRLRNRVENLIDREQELAEARAVIEFYGNKEKYKRIVAWTPIIQDYGTKAREFLERYK